MHSSKTILIAPADWRQQCTSLLRIAAFIGEQNRFGIDILYSSTQHSLNKTVIAALPLLGNEVDSLIATTDSLKLLMTIDQLIK